MVNNLIFTNLLLQKALRNVYCSCPTEGGRQMGSRYRDFRKAAGMRPEEAAAKLEVSLVTLYSWENGRTSPRVTKLTDMADIYGCSTDDLLGRRK